MIKPGDKIEYDRKVYTVVSRAEVTKKWGEDLGNHLFGPEKVWAYFVEGSDKPYQVDTSSVKLIKAKVVRNLPEWF